MMMTMLLLLMMVMLLLLLLLLMMMMMTMMVMVMMVFLFAQVRREQTCRALLCCPLLLPGLHFVSYSGDNFPNEATEHRL